MLKYFLYFYSTNGNSYKQSKQSLWVDNQSLFSTYSILDREIAANAKISLSVSNETLKKLRCSREPSITKQKNKQKKQHVSLLYFQLEASNLPRIHKVKHWHIYHVFWACFTPHGSDAECIEQPDWHFPRLRDYTSVLKGDSVRDSS